MIAEVYPIRRMPRSMAVLDYLIPDEMIIKRGDLVEIPFRAKKIIGIVSYVKDKPVRGIRMKPILSLMESGALTDKELSFFESLAQQIVQPVSNLLHVHFPAPARRPRAKARASRLPVSLSVFGMEAPTISRIVNELTERKNAFVQVPDLRRMAAVITGFYQLKSQKIVVVCPHVHDVEILMQALAALVPLQMTGEESKGQRYEIWQQFRKSSEAILVTTRAGMLFADENTAAVFVVRSGHPDHMQHDRNPRLDSRSVMQLFANHFPAQLFFLDVYPRPEDLHLFGSEHLLTYPMEPLPVVIDAARERTASAHLVLVSSCLDVIEASLAQHKRVLLVYNKKGYAQRLLCQDCGHRAVCKVCTRLLRVLSSSVECLSCKTIQPTPVTCPSCHSTRLSARGYGMERLVEALKKFYPDTTSQIIDADHLDQPNAQIVLVTRAYLERLFDPLVKEPFGCVIHLDPDTPLFSSDFRASHRAFWSLAEWWGLARANQAPFYVLTDEKEWFEQRILHMSETLQEELQRRQDYGQPPFVRWILIRLREPERHKRELEQHQLKERLHKIPEVEVKITSGKIPSESLIQVRFSDQAHDFVFQVFAGLDDRYIIDINAYNG